MISDTYLLSSSTSPFDRRRRKQPTRRGLVDTGAIDCMAPRDVLLAAGVAPEGRAVYELANGQPVDVALNL